MICTYQSDLIQVSRAYITGPSTKTRPRAQPSYIVPFHLGQYYLLIHLYPLGMVREDLVGWDYLGVRYSWTKVSLNANGSFHWKSHLPCTPPTKDGSKQQFLRVVWNIRIFQVGIWPFNSGHQGTWQCPALLCKAAEGQESPSVIGIAADVSYLAVGFLPLLITQPWTRLSVIQLKTVGRVM